MARSKLWRVFLHTIQPGYQPGMFRKFIIVAAWTVFAGIAFVTLSSTGLRPRIADLNVERFGAFAVLGLFLGMAYPGCRALFAVTIVVAAVLFEALQLFIPARDAEYPEMLVKAAGGLAGMGAAIILSRLFLRTD
jgi:hypothetical protein